MSAERSFSVLVQIQGAQAAAAQMSGFTGSLKNASTQITALGGQVDRSVGSFSKYTTTLNSSGRSVQTQLGPLNQFNTGLKNNVTSIDENVTAHGRLNAAMGAGIGFFTSSIGAVGSLAGSFMQLERAGTQLESMQLRLQRAQLALSKATEDVNKLAAQGKQGTLDYSQAVDKQRNAQDAVTLAEDRVGLAQSRLNETYLSFAENILPQTIQGIGGIIAGFTQMRGSMGGVTSALSGLIPSFSNVTKNTTASKDALSILIPQMEKTGKGAAGLGIGIKGIGAAALAAAPEIAVIVAAILSLKNIMDLMPKIADNFTHLLSGDFATIKANALDLVTAAADKLPLLGTFLEPLIPLMKQFGFTSQEAGKEVKDGEDTAASATAAATQQIEGDISKSITSFQQLSDTSAIAGKNTIDMFGQIKASALNNLGPGGYQGLLQNLETDITTTTDTIQKKWLDYAATLSDVQRNAQQQFRDISVISKNSANDTNTWFNIIVARLKDLPDISNTMKGPLIDASHEVATAFSNSSATITQKEEVLRQAIAGNLVPAFDLLGKQGGASIEKFMTLYNDALAAGLDSTSALQVVIKELIDETTRANPVIAELNAKVGSSKKAFDDATKALNDTTSATNRYTIGYYEAATATINSIAALDGDRAALQRHNEETKFGTTYSLAFQQALIKQGEELNKLATDIGNADGAYSKLIEQLATTNIMQQSFKKGASEARLEFAQNNLTIAEQSGKLNTLIPLYQSLEGQLQLNKLGVNQAKQAFLDETIAVGSATSAIKTRENELKSAQGQQLEFTKGVQEQDQVLVKMRESMLQGSGTIAEFGKQLSQDKIYQTAFSLGIQDTILKLDNEKVNLAKTAGSVIEYVNEVHRGELNNITFADSLLTATKALADQRLKLISTAAEFKVLDENIKEEKFLAYAEGAFKAASSIDELTLKIAGLQGENDDLASGLNNTNNLLLRFQLGLEEGKKANIEFVAANNEALGSDVAFRDSIIQTLPRLGVQLPNAIHLSTEALKELEGVAGQAPAQLKALDDWINGFSKSLADNLGKGLEDGSKGFKKAIKDFEQITNIKLDKPLKADFKIEANINNIQKQVDEIIGGLGIELQLNLGTPDSGNIQDYVSKAIDAITEEVNKGGDKVANAFAPTLAVFDKIKNFDFKNGNINELVKDLDLLKAATTDPGKLSLLDKVEESVKRTAAEKGNVTGLTTDITNLAGAAVTATPQMEAYYKSLVGQGVPPAYAAFITSQAAAGIQGTGTAAATAQGPVDKMVTTIRTLAELEAPFQTVMAFFQQSAQRFLGSDLTGIFSSVQKNAQRYLVSDMAGIGNTFKNVAAGMQQAGQRYLAGDLTGIFNSVQKAAQRYLASDMGGIANQAKGAFNNIANAAKSMSNSVISSSNAAQRAVQSLINTLNSVPKNVTSTVTVNHVDRFTTQKFAKGFHGIVTSAMPFIAGEEGPERVDVTPLKSNGLSNENITSSTTNNIITNNTNNSQISSGGRSGDINIDVALPIDGKELSSRLYRYNGAQLNQILI